MLLRFATHRRRLSALKGPHFYDIPSLSEQLRQRLRPLPVEMKGFW